MQCADWTLQMYNLMLFFVSCNVLERLLLFELLKSIFIFNGMISAILGSLFHCHCGLEILLCLSYINSDDEFILNFENVKFSVVDRCGMRILGGSYNEIYEIFVH